MYEYNSVKEIEDVKDRIINSSLIFAGYFGPALFIISFIEDYQSGLRFNTYTDLILVISIVFIAVFRSRINMKFKAYVIILTIYFTLIPDVILFGVLSANMMLVVLIPFFAILTFSVSRTLILFFTSILIIVIIATLHLRNFLSIEPVLHATGGLWIINILFIGLIGIVILLISQKFNLTYEKLIDGLLERKEEIIERERNYREIFNSATDAIFIHNMEGKLVDANAAAIMIFEYNREEFDNIKRGELSSGNYPFTANEFQKFVDKAQNGEKQTFDWLARKKSGKLFWVEVALKKTLISGGERFLAVMRDIDEKKQQLIELEKHRNQLEQLVEERTEELVNSEKMASVGVLASGVAYEINNPLNFIQKSITGIEFYLRDNLEKKHSKKMNPLLFGVKEGVRRIGNIVTSLSHYNRFSESFDEDCDIHSIIDNCLLMLHNDFKNRLTIEKNYTDIPFVFTGNEGKLHQVMINILSNAGHAISESGKIEIATKISDQRLEIIIKDNGHGISKENIRKISDPFFTTKEAGKGTGLGLAITGQIIKEHKGRIKIDSKEKKGTEVRISLPIN